MTTAPEFVERPCIDCGEPTVNDKRCRDCDIDYLLEDATCAACGMSLLDLKPIGLLYPVREAHGFTRACPWMAL